MEALYNIYFAGELLEGQDLATVRQNLGRLFKANEATLDKLFSGIPQLLKRDCDKATALKYQQAMEKAGARPVVKSNQDSVATAAPTTPPESRPMSAADRIAAMAAAPDAGEYPDTEAAAPGVQVDTDGGLDLAAAGTDVLKPEERAATVISNIDTSALDIDDSGQRLSAEPPPPPPAPDSSHLSMGEVGDDIPSLPSELEPLSPNTDALDLSPQGTDFSDCAAPAPQAPDLDLSQLDVAPQGSDVLEEKYRKKEQPVAPATDHIKLED